MAACNVTVPSQISLLISMSFCAGATLVVSGDGRYYSNDAVQVTPVSSLFFQILVECLYLCIDIFMYLQSFGRNLHVTLLHAIE